jgi:uncharacterized membrane protein
VDTEPTLPPPAPAPPSVAEAATKPSRFPLLAAIRRRIISGVVFALPIAITFWIVYWLVSTLQNVLLEPGARIVRRLIGQERMDAMPWWWQEYVSPLIAVVLVLIFLYFLGLFGRSRVYRALDWVLLRVPLVSVIFKAVRNVFSSLEDQGAKGGAKFKRVVLVPFPSRDVRSPAFVTRSMRDVATGRTILCVYIPYCPLPTTGMILMVAEEDVSELNWEVNEAMQAVISLGISTPGTVTFFPSSMPSAAIVRDGDAPL